MKRIVRKVLNSVPRKHVQRVAHIVVPVVGVFYRGRRVECPVCGKTFRKFLPYGYVKSRPGALCPSCLSLERHRMMWMYFSWETDFFSAKPHTLHIAPEYCFLKRFSKALGSDYITADLESPLARVHMDVQDIPFPDEEFDVVICNHILEHVENDRLAISEIYRVLKTEGWGIMLSPVNSARETTYEDTAITTPEDRAAAFGQYDHVREYGRDYQERLAEAGFWVEAIDYASSFPAEVRKRYGMSDEILYLVRKP